MVAAAISRHVYIAVNERFTDGLLIKYSQIERASSVDEVHHPIVRESVRLVGIDESVEISSMADIPAHTGLGSSGAFGVGILKALHAFRRQVRTNTEIAEEACRIEIEVLREPVGKQDQYIAAVGGVTAFEFNSDDSVAVAPVRMSDETRNQLEENLLLFFTGVQRPASSLLQDQDARTKENDSSVVENLETVKRIGTDSYKALTSGDLRWFAELMNEQWELKRSRTPAATSSDIDLWIKQGLQAGAWGAKLVGAGGGGFLLFYCEDNKAGLREAMASADLQEVRFNFDYEGSKLLVV